MFDQLFVVIHGGIHSFKYTKYRGLESLWARRKANIENPASTQNETATQKLDCKRIVERPRVMPLAGTGPEYWVVPSIGGPDHRVAPCDPACPP
jgi:hypothetical protein